MKNLEIECKFDANVRGAFVRATHFLRVLNPAISARILPIQDTYLDHISRDLSSQKIALRVRNTGGNWEATFKTRTEIINGKAVRREETLPLVHTTTLAEALKELARKGRWQKIDVTQLVPQFVISNKRSVFNLSYQGALLEIALDNFAILVAGRKLTSKEIEIELKRGNEKSLEKFVQLFEAYTHLKRAKISKVKTAELLLRAFSK